MELTGAPERVITIADHRGARRTGVRFSRGDTGRATYALALAARLAETGRFRVRVGAVFPLSEIAAAHTAGESGTVRGKLVLVPDGAGSTRTGADPG